MNMKKILAILLALISALSILYCIGSAAENTEKREELQK